MSLEQGTIHAQIWAPPKFFVVDTPSAVATDLGLRLHAAGGRRRAPGSCESRRLGRVRIQGARVVHPAGSGLRDAARRRSGDAVLRGCAVRIRGRADHPGLRRAGRRGARRGPRDRALVRADAGRADALASADPRHDRRASSGLRSHGGARATAAGRHAGGRPARDRRATDRWWNALGLDNASWWRLWMREW